MQNNVHHMLHLHELVQRLKHMYVQGIIFMDQKTLINAKIWPKFENKFVKLDLFLSVFKKTLEISMHLALNSLQFQKAYLLKFPSFVFTEFYSFLHLNLLFRVLMPTKNLYFPV